MQKEYPDPSQRVAVCIRQSTASLVEQTEDQHYFNVFGYTEDISDDFYVPSPDEYEDLLDDPEEIDVTSLVGSARAAEYQGRKVTLNKPFRTPSGPKKFAVYTKNESGNVVIVRFGDPNAEIKRDDPERRRSFRARHNCENPGPKWKARWWSCFQWRAGSPVES